MLLTSSIEAAHVIVPSIPALLGAVFIDAGSAARDFGNLQPDGGLRRRRAFPQSGRPAAALDVAYADKLKEFRLHFGVGVTF